ncbi:MAG TPA: host-nuclease inhibitor Gam family protein [Anaerovoracaceae bacterium]|nr:host-nuclease inhibitor Gam family protein [Anaerovoracaceae bacterium]
MNRLQLAEIQEVETIEKENFKVEDKEQATWVLRKIKALKAQIKETNELADMEIERIRIWQERENQSAEDSISYFKGLLHTYMQGERALDPNLKSIKLPHGTVRFRKQQPEYVRDDNKLIKWAITVGEWNLVKAKESLDWATLKKNISVVDGNAIHKKTGEVIEHINIIPRDDKFEVVVD